MRKILAALLFVSGLAYGDDVDEEIIKDLDFFTNLEIMENHDLVTNLDQMAGTENDESLSHTKEPDHAQN